MADTAVEPRAKKRRLAWLRPPEMSPDGSMALMDHLKEIRYRVTVSALAVLLVTVGSAFFYRQLISIMMGPYNQAKAAIEESNPGATLMVTNDGVVGPVTLAVIATLLSGVILSCPLWIYQIWAFVAPGLLVKEKKYALGFIGAAIPLFLAGVALGYWIWPKGIAVMLRFTPRDMDVVNMLEMSQFLAMEIKILLIFGASFLLPVVIVALNLAGVVKAAQLAKARKVVIFCTFVFAVMVNPSTDPFSLFALAVPMSLLYVVAEFICRGIEKKRNVPDTTEFAIDVNDGK